MRFIMWIAGILALFLLVVNGVMAADTYNFATKWDGFQFSQGITVDAAGNVYVADTGNNRVGKYTPEGGIVWNWSDGKPRDIVVDSTGYVYVLCPSSDKIYKLNPSGVTVGSWEGSTRGSYNRGKFAFSEGLGINSSGTIYVVATRFHQIQEFDANGNWIKDWGSLGSLESQFNYPTDIAFDSAGNSYVTDTLNRRIQKFDSSDKFIKAWDSGGIDLGISVNSSGQVFTSDILNNQIHEFDPDGTPISQWGIPGSGNSEFNNPYSVAVTSSGDYVYVADSGNNRVQKFGRTPTTGSIAVSSNPSGAKIFLDGTDTLHTTPSTLMGIAPGTHGVKLTLSGYSDSTEQSVVVNAGATTPADFTLTPLPTTGSISVTSVPSSAEIFINGVDTGRVTPFTLSGILPGSYTITVKHDGYYDLDEIVSVETGTTVDVDFPLIELPAHGSITVYSVPSSAKIILDNVDTGHTTPYTLNNVLSDTHVVKVTFPGYWPYEKDVTVTSGNTVTVNFPLVAINGYGKIEVIPEIDGSEVWLDGVNTGYFTPYILENIIPGTHTVKVRNWPDYSDASASVVVNEGEISVFRPSLSSETSLGVDSDPKGATVWLDGENTQRITPYSFGVNTGDHTVHVTMAGYEDSAEQKVAVPTSGYYTVILNLKPLPIETPVAAFSADKTSGAVPLMVTFTDQSSGTAPLTYSWNFGDRKTSIEQNTTHTYTRAGSYSVTLTVKNAAGTNITTKTITVTALVKPVAEFTSDITTSTTTRAVQFTDLSEGTPPLAYAWDFGDRKTSTDQNPSHIYAKSGRYTVKLTVSNSAGKNTITKRNYITVT